MCFLGLELVHRPFPQGSLVVASCLLQQDAPDHSQWFLWSFLGTASVQSTQNQNGLSRLLPVCTPQARSGHFVSGASVAEQLPSLLSESWKTTAAFCFGGEGHSGVPRRQRRQQVPADGGFSAHPGVLSCEPHSQATVLSLPATHKSCSE